MSASMAEVLEEHHISPLNEGGWACSSLECDFWDGSFEQATEHQAEVLAANGYGKLEEAWDEGYTTGNAHNGRRDANPYRRPE